MYGEESGGDSYALEGQGGAPLRPPSSISEITDKARTRLLHPKVDAVLSRTMPKSMKTEERTYIEVYKGGK